jgi:hypothetical protein
MEIDVLIPTVVRVCVYRLSVEKVYGDYECFFDYLSECKDVVVTQVIRDKDSTFRSLIGLINNADRREVVVSMLVIGLIYETYSGSEELDVEDLKQAIKPILECANKSNDLVISMAANTTNSILGDIEAVDWVLKYGITSLITDLRVRRYKMRLHALKRINDGWK